MPFFSSLTWIKKYNTTKETELTINKYQVLKLNALQIKTITTKGTDANKLNNRGLCDILKGIILRQKNK